MAGSLRGFETNVVQAAPGFGGQARFPRERRQSSAAAVVDALGRSCCAENDEPLVELGVRCLWVVCFGYCRVRGMVAPRSWNARRWVSVGWASVGTVLSVPAKWTWLRVRVPRWVSSPW